MVSRIDRFRAFFRDKIGYNLVFILVAALLLVGVGAFQYFYTRKLLENEEERVSRMLLQANTTVILTTLKDVESSMKDHAWDIRRSLDHPDSLFGATLRFLESNPLIDGACIAALPDYYPEKGHLFETYAHRVDGGRVVEQIAGPGHDYTQAPGFARAVRERKAFWSDPYEYGTDPVRDLTTYSCPVIDRNGRLAAVCGLDLDLTWLTDTLNADMYYPSSFGFMVSGEGKLVGEPSENKVSRETLAYVTDLLADTTAVRAVKGHNRIPVIGFRDPVTRDRAFVYFKPLPRDPGWTVAQVSYWKEVLAPVRKMMRRIFLMAFACLLFLALIIDLFLRSQRRLREAGIRQATLGSELRIARRIQESMLPTPLPEREDLSIYGLLVPARTVGGDLYDYFIRQGKLFFCIGDVSGKSIPAAIIMSVIKNLFRVVSEREDDPAAIIGALNREGCRNNESGMFVTFFLGILDLSTGVLRYCNAGHDHPVVVGETVEDLSVTANLPIGLFSDFTYVSQETTLPKGTLLFLHTDGVTEARDVHRSFYSRPRLLETIAAAPRDPEALVRAVDESVRHFSEGAEQSDDITMLAFRYDGPAEGAVLDETLTLAGNLSQVSELAGFVRGVTARFDLADRQAKAIRLALEEVIVNVIDYAYPGQAEGTVSVRAWSDGTVLRFTVTDSGIPFDPTGVPPADTTLPAEDRPVGGLGIHLVRSLMDAVRYERTDGKNILTLEKKL